MANQKLYVKDIMTLNPVTVGPDDSVVYAAGILFEHHFNGLPVVNEQKEVIGILTEYDLISKGGDLHMPTLINILGNLDTYKKKIGVVSRFDLVKFFASQTADSKVDPSQPAVLDKKVDEFIQNFEKKISVSPANTQLWSLVGVLIALVGVSI